MARELPRRFYKAVQIGGDRPPFSILADGRQVKTPMKADLAVPVLPLAEALAQEWQDQREVIDPAKMPLTRLSNTAIDLVIGQQSQIVDEIVGFAASDLVCYRADRPDGLVARQTAAWDPLLEFIKERFGARFIAVAGLMHQAQPAAALDAVTAHLTGQDPFVLTATHNITTLTGSCILAIAVQDGRLSVEDAWSAAHVDEDWQIEHWGEDEDAKARRIANRQEFDAALRLLDLVD